MQFSSLTKLSEQRIKMHFQHSSHNVFAFYGYSNAFVTPSLPDVSQGRRGGNCNLIKLI